MKTDNLPRLPWSNLYPKALAAMNKTRPEEFRAFGVDMDLRDVDEDQWDAWGFPGKYPKTSEKRAQSATAKATFIAYGDLPEGATYSILGAIQFQMSDRIEDRKLSALQFFRLTFGARASIMIQTPQTYGRRLLSEVTVQDVRALLKRSAKQ